MPFFRPFVAAMALAGAAGSTSALAEPFDRGGSAAFHHVDVAACRTPDGPRGAGHVQMVVSPDGTVQRATVGAPFAGTVEGACIVAKFRAERVPPFAGEPVRLGKSFVIH